MTKPKRGTLAYEIWTWLDAVHQQNNSLSRIPDHIKAKRLEPFVKKFVEQCGGTIPNQKKRKPDSGR